MKGLLTESDVITYVVITVMEIIIIILICFRTSLNVSQNIDLKLTLGRNEEETTAEVLIYHCAVGWPLLFWKGRIFLFCGF